MRYFGLAVILYAGTSLAQWRAAEGSFDRTLSVSANAVELDVSTGSGKIDIRQGPVNRVEIHGRIRVGTERGRSERDAEDLVRQIETQPPIEQNGNVIRIGRLEGRDFERNVSISYEIVVPAQASIRAHSGSGSQTVTGITGPVNVSTGSGSIRLTDIRGGVHANTGSGGVMLTQAGAGDVDITTGSGSVDASGIRGALRVHTGSGRITVQGEQTGRWDLDTGSGSVNIRLPQNAGFDLNAHSGSGGVYVDHPITVQGRIDRRRNNVSGKVRGGGYALDVRTGSGSIRID
jgi:DUF4097 and DUF4098 domain-containing protein YvlB